LENLGNRAAPNTLTEMTTGLARRICVQWSAEQKLRKPFSLQSVPLPCRRAVFLAANLCIAKPWTPLQCKPIANQLQSNCKSTANQKAAGRKPVVL
jgi:hypothetical protein